MSRTPGRQSTTITGLQKGNTCFIAHGYANCSPKFKQKVSKVNWLSVCLSYKNNMHACWNKYACSNKYTCMPLKICMFKECFLISILSILELSIPADGQKVALEKSFLRYKLFLKDCLLFNASNIKVQIL